MALFVVLYGRRGRLSFGGGLTFSLRGLAFSFEPFPLPPVCLEINPPCHYTASGSGSGGTGRHL
jgi:hypothetical protein